MVRLPLNLRHIRFDESLQSLRFLGDKQSEPKSPSKKNTSGVETLARNQAQTRAKVLKMFEEVRGLGVPLPDGSELRSRSTP